MTFSNTEGRGSVISLVEGRTCPSHTLRLFSASIISPCVYSFIVLSLPHSTTLSYLVVSYYT